MPRPYMRIYWGDYAKKTQHLSTLEHGAYLLLISHYWNTGEPLPVDEEKLRRITRTTTKQWRGMREVILSFFHRDGDKYVHNRVQAELEATSGASTLQSSRAVLGWKTKKKQEAGDATGINPAMPYHIHIQNKPPSVEQEALREGGFLDLDFRNGVFHVIDVLSEQGINAAKQAAPGWDIYHLAGIYDESVKKMGKPRNANTAFPAWCAKYTKGKKL